MGPAEDGKEKKPHKGDQERMFIEEEGELGKYTVVEAKNSSIFQGESGHYY